MVLAINTPLPKTKNIYFGQKEKLGYIGHHNPLPLDGLSFLSFFFFFVVVVNVE